MKGTVGLKKGSVPFENDLETTLMYTHVPFTHRYDLPISYRNRKMKRNQDLVKVVQRSYQRPSLQDTPRGTYIHTCVLLGLEAYVCTYGIK